MSFDLRLIFLPKGYCNYRCTFCHHEGLNDPRAETAASHSFNPTEIAHLVHWLRHSGLNGLTISGGEPLLQLGEVIEIGVALKEVPITIVTNGTRLTQLARRIDELSSSSLRLNINLPSFNPTIFRRLTGQIGFAPSTIVAPFPRLIGAGVEVNLNCVVCEGENDSAHHLASYADRAEAIGVSNVRFLIDTDWRDATRNAFVQAIRGNSTDLRSRRGGRVTTLQSSRSCGIEVVTCESKPSIAGAFFQDGRSDIYLTSRKTIKFGLYDEESSYRDFESLRSAIAERLGLTQ